MLDPKQMQAFVVLAEHMHFGRAAKALGISQSTLSTQIRTLEETIGGALINRSNRTMTLTALGETFLVDARNILAMMECALRNTSDVLDGTVSSLTIGVDTGGISSGLFVQILAQAREQFPRLELMSIEEPPATLLTELCSGHIDVVLSNTFSLDIPKNVVQHPIVNWRAVLVAHKSLSLTDQAGTLAIDAVSEQPFLLFEHQSASPHVIEHVFAFRPKRVLRLPSVRLIADYVEERIGVAVLPEADLKLLGPNTVAYPIDDVQMPVKLMRLNNSNSPTMIRFCHMVRTLFATNG